MRGETGEIIRMPESVIDERYAHEWNVDPSEAADIQRELRSHVITENRLGTVNLVAGVDVGFPSRDTARAAVVILRFPQLVPVAYAVAEKPVQFPYIPGLLAFREVPVVLSAVKKLQRMPDLFIFDAHGLAHPRRLGLASHAGLLLDTPSIGCAKSRLVGQSVEPGLDRGDHVPLVHEGEQIGAVLRTRAAVKPVYVSIGHKVDLETAVQYVLDCAPRYRLPETTRYADRVADGQELDLDMTSYGS
jgi:deoxyribonuclease V